MNGYKLILKTSKSGREAEVAFIPQKVANRLREYVENRNIEADQQVSPLEAQKHEMQVVQYMN